MGYRRQDLPRDPPAKPLILTEVPSRDTAPRPRKIHLGIIDNLPGHIATVTPRSSRPAKTDRHITTPTKNPAGAGLSAGPSGASRTFGPRFKQDRSFQNPAKAPLSRAFTAPLCSAQSLNHCRNVACSDHLRRDPPHLTPPWLARRSIGLISWSGARDPRSFFSFFSSAGPIPNLRQCSATSCSRGPGMRT